LVFCEPKLITVTFSSLFYLFQDSVMLPSLTDKSYTKQPGGFSNTNNGGVTLPHLKGSTIPKAGGGAGAGNGGDHWGAKYTAR
jgi:hypothetical protein